MSFTRGAFLCLLFIASALLISGCCFLIPEFSEPGGTYSCAYESRHTGCGGTGWSAWENGCAEFNEGDYKDGWTPQQACGKYSGSDTECGGSCCISTEYRNNEVSSGGCA